MEVVLIFIPDSPMLTRKEFIEAYIDIVPFKDYCVIRHLALSFLETLL
jgi:hypothetical protein